MSKDAILDRTLKNDEGRGTDGEELISKRKFESPSQFHGIVFQEPVKAKPPAAVAASGVSQSFLRLGIYQQ